MAARGRIKPHDLTWPFFFIARPDLAATSQVWSSQARFGLPPTRSGQGEMSLAAVGHVMGDSARQGVGQRGGSSGVKALKGLTP